MSALHDPLITFILVEIVKLGFIITYNVSIKYIVRIKKYLNKWAFFITFAIKNIKFYLLVKMHRLIITQNLQFI